MRRVHQQNAPGTPAKCAGYTSKMRRVHQQNAPGTPANIQTNIQIEGGMVPKNQT